MLWFTHCQCCKPPCHHICRSHHTCHTHTHAHKRTFKCSPGAFVLRAEKAKQASSKKFVAKKFCKITATTTIIATRVTLITQKSSECFKNPTVLQAKASRCWSLHLARVLENKKSNKNGTKKLRWLHTHTHICAYVCICAL